MDFAHLNIAFIGSGNMAQALMSGLLRQGHPAGKMWATARSQATLDKVLALGDIHTTTDNHEAAAAADVIVLAVKPQMLKAVATDMATSMTARPRLILSVAAGITTNSLRSWLGEDQAIVRCMPNTPSLLGVGAAGLFAGKGVSEEQRNIAANILDAAGLSVWVDEETKIDAVTAVSGSGPAYYFLFMEAMIAAGTELGLSPQEATQLTLQTALGASRMALESPDDPGTLRTRVTSPGGTTEQALKAFEAAGLRSTVRDAMQACANRAAQLAEELGK